MQNDWKKPLRGMRAGLALVALVGACSPLVRDFGYAPTDTDLAEIAVGVDSRDRVAELVGSPATDSLEREDAWYYLASRQETVAFRAPVTTDRQIVMISFNGEGTVTNIERFTLEDGRLIRLSRRVTEENTRGVGFLRQIIGNFGNFDGSQVLDEGI